MSETTNSNRPPYETFTKPTCRGAYALGTACGTCEKCEWERARLFPSEPIPPAARPGGEGTLGDDYDVVEEIRSSVKTSGHFDTLTDEQAQRVVDALGRVLDVIRWPAAVSAPAGEATDAILHAAASDLRFMASGGECAPETLRNHAACLQFLIDARSPAPASGAPDEEVNAEALRRYAAELQDVNWSGGSCGAQTIDDAADEIASLRTRLAAAERAGGALREDADRIDVMEREHAGVWHRKATGKWECRAGTNFATARDAMNAIREWKP